MEKTSGAWKVVPHLDLLFALLGCSGARVDAFSLRTGTRHLSRGLGLKHLGVLVDTASEAGMLKKSFAEPLPTSPPLRTSPSERNLCDATGRPGLNFPPSGGIQRPRGGQPKGRLAGEPRRWPREIRASEIRARGGHTLDSLRDGL